jgi:hypothetical protein
MPFEVLIVREGTKLAAADPISAEAIAGIKLRETVTASIRRSRNPKRHRKLWALLTVVYDSQSVFATKEDLLNAIKLATGLFETGLTVDRVPYVVPQSISFAAMDQNRFEQRYEKVLEVILTKIVPNASAEGLSNRVQEIIDGYS